MSAGRIFRSKSQLPHWKIRRRLPTSEEQTVAEQQCRHDEAEHGQSKVVGGRSRWVGGAKGKTE